MLSEDARYMSAGAELAARIQARDFVLLSYIAFSATILTLSLVKPSVGLVSLAIPYLAVAAAFLNAHHDAVIGLLSGYMKSLETHCSVVAWHNEPKYIGRALNARLLRDIAAIVFLVLSSATALWITKTHLEATTAMSQATGLWWGGVFSIFITIIVFVGLFHYRHEKWPFNQGNG